MLRRIHDEASLGGVVSNNLAGDIHGKDALGRCSDFHALLGTGNTLLGGGVYPSIRKKVYVVAVEKFIS